MYIIHWYHSTNCYYIPYSIFKVVSSTFDHQDTYDMLCNNICWEISLVNRDRKYMRARKRGDMNVIFILCFFAIRNRDYFLFVSQRQKQDIYSTIIPTQVRMEGYISITLVYSSWKWQVDYNAICDWHGNTIMSSSVK